MADLADGESVPMQGSGSKPYLLKNVGGVYSCSCPAWRNQSTAIERRTCKHLRKLRGDAAEEARIGGPAPTPAKAAAEDKAAPPLLLAETWDNETDLTGWWMSEKLDGVRAYWDGKQFLSRQGNRYHAPDWFTAELPKEPLDGELWLGRKKFQRTVSIARRQDKSDLWKELRFVVFDAPGQGGDFEARLAFLRQFVKRYASPYVTAHAHEACKGLDRAAIGTGPRGGAGRRGADAASTGVGLRGRPVAHVVKGEALPRRRGQGGRLAARRRPAQGAARGVAG